MKNAKLVGFFLVLVFGIPGCRNLPSLGAGYYGDGMSADTLTWIFEEGGSIAGINRDATQGATFPQTAVFNGKLYATWVESNGSNTLVRVSVYNGNDAAPGWSAVEGAKINYSSSMNADTPQLVVFNGKLYASWSEANGTISQIHVAVYNGTDSAPGWTYADGTGANGINFNVLKDATTPRFGVYAGELYLIWSEVNGNTQIRVRKYNGNDLAPDWTVVLVDPGTGMNVNSGNNASNPILTVLNNKLYAIWSEVSPAVIKNQIRARVYTPTNTWTLVDGADPNYGRNKDTSRSAQSPEACLLNGKLYVVWQEFNAAANQVRLVTYDGTSWSPVDGNGVSGLNKDATRTADEPHCVVYNSKLYLTWQEANSGLINQTRVAVYNGNDAAPAISFADGGGDKGINKDTALNAQNPRLNVFNGDLFAIWTEFNSVPRKQVRAASGL